MMPRQDGPEWVMVCCPRSRQRFVLHQWWPRFRGRIVDYNAGAPCGPEGYMGIEWLDEAPAEDICQDLMVAAIEFVEASDPAADRIQCCEDTNETVT